MEEVEVSITTQLLCLYGMSYPGAWLLRTLGGKFNKTPYIPLNYDFVYSLTYTHTHIHTHTRSLSLSSVGVCLFSSNWSVSYANLFPDVFYNCQIGILMLSLFCSQQFIAAVSGVLYDDRGVRAVLLTLKHVNQEQPSWVRLVNKFGGRRRGIKSRDTVPFITIK